MVNVNFVPDDYVQTNELRRTNYLYLLLFALLMGTLAGTFGVIKVRQQAILATEESVNQKINQAQAAIEQYEQLQQRRQDMMRTALTTMRLPDPVPRSVLLACLTNNLPAGVTFLDLKLIQQPSQRQSRQAANTYSQYQKENSEQDQQSEVRRPDETNISIEGIAPSDLQVASYIERLSSTELLTDVSLIESKEHTVDEQSFRRFRLSARLNIAANLTAEQIEKIRSSYQAQRAF